MKTSVHISFLVFVQLSAALRQDFRPEPENNPVKDPFWNMPEAAADFFARPGFRTGMTASL